MLLQKLTFRSKTKRECIDYSIETAPDNLRDKQLDRIVSQKVSFHSIQPKVNLNYPKGVIQLPRLLFLILSPYLVFFTSDSALLTEEATSEHRNNLEA